MEDVFERIPPRYYIKRKLFNGLLFHVLYDSGYCRGNLGQKKDNFFVDHAFLRERVAAEKVSIGLFFHL